MLNLEKKRKKKLKNKEFTKAAQSDSNFLSKSAMSQSKLNRCQTIDTR